MTTSSAHIAVAVRRLGGKKYAASNARGGQVSMGTGDDADFTPVELMLAAIALVLCTGVLLHLFPFWWMVVSSLKPTREIFERPFSLWPHAPTLASYRLLFSTLSASGLNINARAAAQRTDGDGQSSVLPV